MKKIFWAILALLAGLGYFLVAPITEDLGNWVEGLGNCFKEDATRLDQLSKRAGEENWGKEERCEKGKEEFALLKSCVNDVRKKRKVPEFVVSAIQQIIGAKGVMENQMKDHNRVCSEYPTTLIAE